MRIILLVLAVTLTAMIPVSAQQARIIKLPELEKLLNPVSDTTYVINFWATWCKPCIKELTVF